MRAALDWLTARPIAHRGLHDAANGVIENTAAAVRAAIDAGYGIEVDLQVSVDGEAMVHHDDVLGRLTEGEGRLDQLTAAELKRIAFRGVDARMLTLGELCDLVDGRTALLLELKSRFDGDNRLGARVAAVAGRYRGPVFTKNSRTNVRLRFLFKHARGVRDAPAGAGSRRSGSG